MSFPPEKGTVWFKKRSIRIRPYSYVVRGVALDRVYMDHDVNGVLHYMSMSKKAFERDMLEYTEEALALHMLSKTSLGS